MKIRMLKTAMNLGYRFEIDNDGGYHNRTYDIEFIVKADENTKLSQIDNMLTSFCRLKSISNELYIDKRMITQDMSNKRGIFTAKMCLYDEICYDEFMCETDDFKSFEWYARNIKIEEKSEDFEPIN